MTRVKLADLPIKWLRGNGFRKTDLVQNGEYGCILYGELFTKHKSPLIQSSKLSRTNRIGNVSTIAGDILIPGTSTAKKSDMVLGREVNSDGVFLGGDINVIRPQQGLFASRFLPYFLESQDALEQLEPYIQGATGIIHLSNKGIKSLEVPLPPLSEQQRIVAILDEAFAAIDQAKANTERNLKNAKELFESSLQEMFEKRGDGWDEKILEELTDEKCTLSYGIVQPGEEFKNGLPVIRPTDLRSRFIKLERLKRIDPKLANGYKRTKLIGDELLLCVRGTTGVVSIATPELKDANVTRGIVPIRFNPNIVNQDFGYYLLISNYVQQQIRAKTYGAALMQINLGDLRKIKTPYPPLKDQQTIVRQLNDLKAETQKLEAVYQKKLLDLDELKKSILQKAFAGELTTA